MDEGVELTYTCTLYNAYFVEKSTSNGNHMFMHMYIYKCTCIYTVWKYSVHHLLPRD